MLCKILISAVTQSTPTHVLVLLVLLHNGSCLFVVTELIIQVAS